MLRPRMLIAAALLAACGLWPAALRAEGKAKEVPAPAAAPGKKDRSAAKSPAKGQKPDTQVDHFIDANQDGVDDRHQAKVVRSKTERKPRQPAASPKAEEAPPPKTDSAAKKPDR